jgi:phosphoserine aminotransferase
MARVMNFSAGPAALPLPALERAQAELTDFAGTGMSVMEQSHRGKDYEKVHDEAIALMRELLAVPDDYDVLFVQGGASQQFATVPLSFLHPGKTADYVVCGAWGEKALAEAKTTAALFGASVHVACTTGTGDGKEKAYHRVPVTSELRCSDAPAYVHTTTNETIHGVQLGADAARPLLQTKAPQVCDMSSDFLWRPIDVSRFALIYAGAQKNIGPSGVVVAIAKKDFVAEGRKDIPKIFQYRTFAAEKSLYNTPPTFGIYLVRNVLAWVKEQGGLAAMEKRNREKAQAIYAAIDESGGWYRTPIEKESRSVMNVVFRLPTEALEDKLVADAKNAGMVGLKGHRSVGGIRVSLYNAVPPEHAKALASFMREFAKANG